MYIFKSDVCFSLVKSTPIFNQEQSLQTSARLHSETNLDSNFKENQPLCNATNFLNPTWTGVFLGQSTEVRFASFLSGGFTTMAVINPPEMKLVKRIFVHWAQYGINNY